MTEVPTERIRDVALVGHGGVGKTTLAEALLAAAGVVERPGRVEDGTAVADALPEERRRGSSLSLAVVPVPWGDHLVNLLVAPGEADLEGEALVALRVADLAVFVVSAVAGVEVQHERLWRAAAEAGLPRMVFVNQLDRERASFERTLDQLRDRFGAGIAPLELPVGAEAGFRGVVDLLSDQAFTYGAGERRARPGPVPDDMAAREHEVHDALVEGIVVADDELLERYLSGEVPTVAELERTLAVGVDGASVFPVVCGSALTGVGVDRLADLVCEVGPSPRDRPPVVVGVGGAPSGGGPTAEVAADPDGEPLAFVFKTVVDPYVGQLSVFRVLSGTVVPDAHLVNPRTGVEERLHALVGLRGREHLPTGPVPAGGIAAAPKLSGTRTGDTLAPRGAPVVVEPLSWPEPVLGVAVRARDQRDEDKLATALHRLVDEDPSLVVTRDDETHQTVVRGAGEAHLQLALDRLADRFGVAVETEDVRVAYRETATAPAEAEGRHKKQSGGHGQFGVARLRLEPLERGAGFEFVDQVVGGAIPRQYLPAVERGVVEAMAEGGPHGFPVVDVRVVCLDGKHHPVDSSEMSFKAAARLAFRQAMEEAGAVVLEPVSHVEVVVPADLQGEVLGDLSAHRGRVQGTELAAERGEVTVVALVPTAELRRYATELRARTGGRGRFTARHERWDPLPEHLAAVSVGA